MYYINTDGGSRGNPGEAACAYVLTGHDGKVEVSAGQYLGIATNNEAEYSGLILGLKTCVQKEINECVFRLDSELVVKQVNGQYKVKNDRIEKLYNQVKDLLKNFRYTKFEYVPRAQNALADKIVNQVLDEQKKA